MPCPLGNRVTGHKALVRTDLVATRGGASREIRSSPSMLALQRTASGEVVWRGLSHASMAPAVSDRTLASPISRFENRQIRQAMRPGGRTLPAPPPVSGWKLDLLTPLCFHTSETCHIEARARLVTPFSHFLLDHPKILTQAPASQGPPGVKKSLDEKKPGCKKGRAQARPFHSCVPKAQALSTVVGSTLMPGPMVEDTATRCR